jgi:hypothetical protein
MTISTQLRTTEGTGSLAAGNSESRPCTASTLKWIFVGRDGLRADDGVFESYDSLLRPIENT